MKKLLKILGLTALIAAIPVRSSKDSATGERTYETLLSKLKVRSKEDGKGADIRIDLLGGLIPESLRIDGEYDDYYYDDDILDDDGDFDEPPKETVFEVSMKVERDLPQDTEAEERIITDEPQAEPDETEDFEEEDLPEPELT